MIFSKLEQLGGREKAFLIVGVVILLGALADRFVVQLVVDRLDAMQSAIEIERERLAYNKIVVENRDEVARAYEQVRDKLAAATTPASDLDLMKGQIDDLAIRTQIEVIEVKHREPRVFPHYSQYMVDIAFQGAMQNVLTFLHAMQNSDSPGLLAVDQLNVGVGRQKETIRGAMTITKIVVDG